MTSIAKCGTSYSPHVIHDINGVGTCFECGAKFIDGLKQDE